MGSYRVISADSHVFEPPDLWTSRIEPRFRDRAPRILRMKGGGDWWVCDGYRGMSAFSGAQTGRRFEAPEKMTVHERFENVRPGGYIPEEHVKDMTEDGVDVSIVYPSAAMMMFNLPDTELLSAVFHAYNGWLAEFCQPFPSQLKGIGILNVDDVRDGVAELERCAKMGLAGALVTVYPPQDRPYDSPEYEPLWAAAQDLNMPLSLHAASNRGQASDFKERDIMKPSTLVNMDYWVRESLAHIIFSGVFERYPKLYIGSVELELAWVPHFLERMDYTHTQRTQNEFWYRFKEDMLPSEYFHRNVFVGFQEDAIGIRMRDLIGVDNLQWGSDYPHPESTFPRTRQILAEVLADCTEEEKAKIAGGNASRVYHLD